MHLFPVGLCRSTLLIRSSFSWCRALAFALLAACIANVAACPLQSAPTSHVTDPGGLLGQHARDIDAKLAAYQAASGHQLVLLVVPSLDAGVSIEECAVAIFSHWKIGRAKIDDGVLLLIAVKEKRVRIEVGYGLEGVLTDAQSSRIIRELMQPLLAQGDYTAASSRGFGAIITLLGTPEPASPPAPTDQGPSEAILQAFCASMLLLVLAATPLLGIVGLFISSVPVVGLACWVYPDSRAFLYLFATLCAAAWCAVRWRFLSANVKKYHLKKSRYKTLTWIWHFLAIGNAAPVRKRRAAARKVGAPAFEVSFGFSDSSDNGNDSNDDESGGRSGGGGASGSW
jgi:uncharacterized protein